MKERYLLIDDLRSWSDVWVDAKPDLTKEDPHFKYYVSEEDIELVIARTFEEGIERVKEGGWDFLWLDHDLNDEDPRKTGYEIICYIEEHPELAPKEFKCVSSNPTGRDKINAAWQSILRRAH